MAVAQNELSNIDNQQILCSSMIGLMIFKPMVKHFDHNDEYPTEIVSQMKELGLFCLMYPVEYGGMGMNASSYAKVISRLERDMDEPGWNNKYPYDARTTHITFLNGRAKKAIFGTVSER